MRLKPRLAARLAALGLVACLGLALGGCGRDPGDEPGVVAVVGGEPIRLADVRARHDLSRIGASEVENPAVERLRAEYGAVAADMIVAKLAAQELARRGLAVTQAEIDAAEAKVRADYSEEAFSRLLLEERIDYARWREALADRLALEKLSREVLRPGLRVDVTEAANYYKDHIDAFAQPARIRLRCVTGETPEALKAAQAAVRKSGPTALDGQAGITATEADLPEANLPAAWREAVKGLKPGEASAVVPAAGQGGEFFILLGRRPASVLEPAKAYARVEAVLAARKLDAAFAAWLDTAVAHGGVRVSKRLLQADAAQGTETAAAPAADELALARQEAGSRANLAEEAKKALAQKRVAPQPQAEQAPSAAPTAARPAQPTTPSPATAQAPAAEPGRADDVGRQEPAPARPAAATPASQTAETAKGDGKESSPTKPATAEPASQPAKAALSGAETAKDGGQASPSAQTAAAEPAAPTAATTPAPSPEKPTPTAAAPVPDQAASAPAVPAEPAPDATASAQPAATNAAGHEIIFTAIKASWILYTVDDGQEQRVYLKPGKPLPVAYAKKLVVRPGSPSELSYQAAGKETKLVVGKKESRVLEFP